MTRSQVKTPWPRFWLCRRCAYLMDRREASHWLDLHRMGRLSLWGYRCQVFNRGAECAGLRRSNVACTTTQKRTIDKPKLLFPNRLSWQPTIALSEFRTVFVEQNSSLGKAERSESNIVCPITTIIASIQDRTPFADYHFCKPTTTRFSSSNIEHLASPFPSSYMVTTKKLDDMNLEELSKTE